jgi:predicted Zn-dependent peptidase
MGTQQSASSCSEEIQKLYDLKEKGIITQEEFEAKKKALL